MDQIINVLFNPNHEAPSLWVVAVLLVIALVLPALTNYVGRNRNSGGSTQAKPQNKKRGGKKK